MAEESSKDLPADVQPLYRELAYQTTMLHAKWRLYLDLFAKPESLEVINDTVPGVFTIIEDALRQDMVMAIGRLTDPAAIGGRTNLSLERFVSVLGPHCDREFNDWLVAKLLAVRDQCEHFKTLRNKKVGHSDLQTALGHLEPLPAISRSHVDDALKEIRELLNEVTLRLRDSMMAFDRVLQVGTGIDLISYLRSAMEQKKKELRRLRGIE